MNQTIPLASLLPADFDPAHVKLHCAVYNGIVQPIDVLTNEPEEWANWNRWRNVNDDFNRDFIFALPRIGMTQRCGSSAASGRSLGVGPNPVRTRTTWCCVMT